MRAQTTIREIRRTSITAAVMACLLLLGTPPANGIPTVVFQDNFNHDTPGSQPGLDPPLEPPGDVLYIRDWDGSILVSSSEGDLTDQPLKITSGGNAYFRVEAFVDPDYQDCDTYTVSFRSFVAVTPFFTTVAVRDTSNRLIGSLEYRDARRLSFNGSGNQLATQWTANVGQLFEWTIDMQAMTIDLSIDGVPQPEVQGRPFYQTADSFERLAITGTGAWVLVVDDIEIYGDGCSATAVEPVTWGRVKASYAR